MAHIGSVIHLIREKAGISRSELCDGVCTEKYLYLIERGKRTPSSEILRIFSGKLRQDMFLYYEYLDCQDPVDTQKSIELFDLYRYRAEYDKLSALLEKASRKADFLREPWVYEIDLNRLFLLVMRDKQFEQGYLKAEEILRHIPSRYGRNLFAVELHLIQTVCALFLRRYPEASQSLAQADEIFNASSMSYRSTNVKITLDMNKLYLGLRTEQYPEAIAQGEKLYRYQAGLSNYDRIDLTCFYLAYSYLGNKDDDLAHRWFKKGLYIDLFEKSNTFSLAINYDAFRRLLLDKRTPRVLVDELMKQYSL